MATLDAEIITCFWQELSNFMADTCKVCHSCFLQSVKTSSTHLKKKNRHTFLTRLSDKTHTYSHVFSLDWTHTHTNWHFFSYLQPQARLKNYDLCDSSVTVTQEPCSVICLWLWLKNHVLCHLSVAVTQEPCSLWCVFCQRWVWNKDNCLACHGRLPTKADMGGHLSTEDCSISGTDQHLQDVVDGLCKA